MKQAKTVAQFLCVAALAALLSACTATGPTATASTEAMLTQAGFTTHVATTAKQKAHLLTMAPGKLAIVKKNGKNVYIYPDPAHNQVYAGNEAQYKAFKAARDAQTGAAIAAENPPAMTYTTPRGVDVDVYEGWVPFADLP